jgi:prepilin-type processing-associated H-X9-DG protein
MATTGSFSHAPPRLRTADVLDGLSNTACFSEILHTADSSERLRVNWMTPRRYESADQFEDFLRACRSVPENPVSAGWRGVPSRGIPWTDSNIGNTYYTHSLPPNEASCQNQALVQIGIYTVASAHQGGANLLFADGHVTFVASSVDLRIWTEFGSRGTAAASQ